MDDNNCPMFVNIAADSQSSSTGSDKFLDADDGTSQGSAMAQASVADDGATSHETEQSEELEHGQHVQDSQSSQGSHSLFDSQMSSLTGTTPKADSVGE